MTDFWDDAANSEIEPPPEREDLPVGKWVLARTATSENGGWAPQVQTREGAKGTFYQFRLGLISQGGEPPIGKPHIGRYFPFSSFIEPGDYDGGNPLSGKLMGFLNACFAPGVAEGEKDSKARATARWKATCGVLAQVEDQLAPPGEYPSTATRIAAAAVKVLEAETRFLLAKTSENKNKKTGQVYGVEAGQIEDYTSTNVAKRKVVVGEGESVPPPTGGGGGKEF